MSVRVDAETLRSIPIFAECEAVHLQLLAFSAEPQTFKAGDHIMVQGQVGSSAFVILGGTVELKRGQGDIAEPVGMAGPGAFLGEVAMIGGVPYSLTATARTDVAAAKISRALFMRVAEEYADFGATVFRMLARKLDSSISELGIAQGLLDQAKSFSDL